MNPIVVSASSAQVGEADVDGDAAFLLLFEAVRIDPGQRLDERGLAVIDVPGGSDDDVGHRPYSAAAAGRREPRRAWTSDHEAIATLAITAGPGDQEKNISLSFRVLLALL